MSHHHISYIQIRDKYPFFRKQNTIGFFIFTFSILACVTMSILWWQNVIPAWLMIIVNAFFFGILHELEHDLIHWMYFKNNKIIHHFMLFIIWIVRPLTINPWIRRQLHYHHHKYSGTIHDVEERGVTNGENWSFKRLLTTPDLVIGGLLRVHSLFKDIKSEVELGNLKLETANKLKKYAVVGLIPITIITHIILYAFSFDLLFNLSNKVFNTNIAFPEWIQLTLIWLKPVIYIILTPNLIRQFCLHFITSNLHYYGDVENGNVVEQTQVLNVWWTFPMQLFCFFFGWTHAIHHFAVNETFYIRHITRKKAHKIMKANGVRFNDLGTFKRANRFHDTYEI